MLLLGDPGSGKTTTILHIARQLLAEMEHDPSAPLPLILNLSKLRLEQPKRSRFFLWRQETPKDDLIDERVLHWLIDELTIHPRVSKDTAQTWLNEGRFAFLLDGLDEVDDEYRSEMVRVLNGSFLNVYPDAVVVICSRIHEYQALHGPETRLQLNGGVTLQPLSDPQIRRYLDATRATGLMQAIQNDQDLYEMAKTPLTISMMVLAYGSATGEDISADLALSNRRHRLMETYVEKMLQRKERRDRGIHFDRSREADVSTREYAYSPEKVNRYLGWLALRLSVRMQTSYSFNQFYSFLAQEQTRDRQPFIWWALRISRAPLLFLGSLLAGLAVMPMSKAGVWGTLAIALAGTGLGVLALRIFHSEDSRTSWLQTFASFVAITWFASGVLGVGSHALSSMVPIGIAPVSMGLVVVCLSIAVGMVLISIEETEFRVLSISLGLVTLSVFSLALVSMRLYPNFKYIAYLPGVTLATVQAIFLAIWLGRKEGREEALSVLVIAFGICVCQALGVWLVGKLEWYAPLIVLVSIADLIFFIDQAENNLSLWLVLLFVAFGLGGIFGGVAGSFATVVILGLIFFLPYILLETSMTVSDYPKGLDVSLTGLTEKFAERYLYSPALVWTLALGRCLPVRFRRFSTYAEQTLLLKRSAHDFEFVHRLLRDYFALRDLQPKLMDKNLKFRTLK
ncbi:MAG: NACHT domain-containing protein [Deltaproteobacteria bacterium]|nr:NACHT domain-containing protein [Deltaproteobacteria bacterium]